jgi:hypothetical protein
VGDFTVQFYLIICAIFHCNVRSALVGWKSAATCDARSLPKNNTFKKLKFLKASSKNYLACLRIVTQKMLICQAFVIPAQAGIYGASEKEAL